MTKNDGCVVRVVRDENGTTTVETRLRPSRKTDFVQERNYFTVNLVDVFRRQIQCTHARVGPLQTDSGSFLEPVVRVCSSRTF